MDQTEPTSRPLAIEPRWLKGIALVGGSAFVAFAAAIPLGLDRVAAAPTVAEAIALAGPFDPGHGGPLATLIARACAYLPLGDLALRVALASALVGALGLAAAARFLLVAVRPLRPAQKARLSPRELTYEPVAVVGGIAAAALSLGPFRALTSAGSGAVTLVVVMFGLAATARLALRPSDAAAGLASLFLAGLSAGVDPVALSIVAPPALLVWLWALRRGERWPLFAPLVLVAGLGVVLGAAAMAEPHAPVMALVSRLLAGDLRAALAAAARVRVGTVVFAVGEELGVVAVLLGSVGMLVLLLRAPSAGALVLYALWAALISAAAVVGAPPRGENPARLLVAALFAAPVAAGIVHLSEKLGRGRLAAAAALALLAALPPSLDGGQSRWTRDHRLPERLLGRAIEAAGPRAVVDPGSAEMDGLFRYARTLGVRPDLDLRPAR